MSAEPAPTDLELLRSHAPRLSFDSMEALRPARIDAYLDGSVVWDRDGQMIDASGWAIDREGGQVDLMLNPLAQLALADDWEQGAAEHRSDALLATYEAQQDPAAQGTCYGRVTRRGGAVFLQYWFFYVDNARVLARGRHDGDWEFVQIRLTGYRHRPTHITVAQHGAPETRRLPPDVQHPEVFVANGSHASYLTRGSQPGLPSDDCDAGRRPEKGLVIEQMPPSGWPYWRGRWGTDKKGGTALAMALDRPHTPFYLSWLSRVGAGESPPSPRWQHLSWSAPVIFQQQGAAHRFTRAAWRGFLHQVGRLTAPTHPAEVRVVRAGATSIAITASARGRLLRRTVHVAVALEDAPTTRVLAAHTVKADGRSRGFQLVSAGHVSWRAAGYNRLWQRGSVSEPAPVGASE